MESGIRKPFQGVLNIIRFNWHFYAFAVFAVLFIFLVRRYFISLRFISDVFILLVVCSTFISLTASAYIYDFSDLYKLTWLNDLQSEEKQIIINVNAGFDETSRLLKARFEDSEIIVTDFYNPLQHTAVSIKRARKAYPPFPGTIQVSTTKLPFTDNSADMFFAIMAAHEIINEEERTGFFEELNRVLKPTGKVIVTEHLRDTANFLVYNIGFFHFHSKNAWLKTFHLAGFKVSKEIKTTPFITTFILEKNGYSF